MTTHVQGSRNARTLAIACAVAAIWTAVAAASMFAPDLVSGSEQEHIPLTAFTAWFWGLISTTLVAALLLARRTTPNDTTWYGFAIAISGVWAAVGLFAIFGPELVTGSDPTRVPIAGLLGPVVGTALTGLACVFVALLSAVPTESPRTLPQAPVR